MGPFSTGGWVTSYSGANTVRIGQLQDGESADQPTLFERAVAAKTRTENALRMSSPQVQKARDICRDAGSTESFAMERLRQRVDALDCRISPHMHSS